MRCRTAFTSSVGAAERLTLGKQSRGSGFCIVFFLSDPFAGSFFVPLKNCSKLANPGVRQEPKTLARDGIHRSLGNIRHYRAHIHQSLGLDQNKVKLISITPIMRIDFAMLKTHPVSLSRSKETLPDIIALKKSPGKRYRNTSSWRLCAWGTGWLLGYCKECHRLERSEC